MKIIYLASTYFTLYLIYKKFKATYDKNHDTFRIEFLLLPSAVLALLWNHEYSVLEVNRITFALNSFGLKAREMLLDSLDVFNLLGIRCYTSPIVYG